jgi:hypothetical protein
MSTPRYKQGRPTIGLFTYGMRGTVAVDMWLGVADDSPGLKAGGSNDPASSLKLSHRQR